MERATKSIRPHYRLEVAKGSLSELETQVLIAKDLGYTGDVEGVLNQAEKVSRLLAGLHKKVLAG